MSKLLKDSAQLCDPDARASDAQSKESQLTLELLQTIDQRDDISQRHLAKEMGVALGLANSYLKRCVKKGWIKVSTAPANRYLYYLTPTGFAEKARLTSEFFTTSFALFRQAGNEYTGLLANHIADLQGEKPRLLLMGLSDLTEIALMRAQQAAMPVVGIYQPSSLRNEFFGVPVFTIMPDVSGYDSVVITSMEQTDSMMRECEHVVSPTRVLVPPMLLTMNYRNSEAGQETEIKQQEPKNLTEDENV